MNKNELVNYGMTDELVTLATATPDFELGRVTSQNRHQYIVKLAADRITATVAGRFENMTNGPEDFPAVGDWVLVLPPQTAGDWGVIQRLIPRTSVFIRKAAGGTSNLQVVAANVDVLFLCMALDANFNVRRLERYLAVARNSGAKPVVVLTKSDLTTHLAERINAVQDSAGDATLLTSSTTTDVGWQEVAQYIVSGKTYAFLGSSGVGKSTLINYLLGHDTQSTAAIRTSDAHGRHTTTNRELFLLPNGGIVIDTPGMRELSIVDANLEDTFADITELATYCKFRDCTHQGEPGCAVQAAIENNTLSVARFKNYQQLTNEQTVNQTRRNKSRERENAKIERMFGSKKNMKAMIKASRNRH